MVEMESRGFLSTEFNTRIISETIAELGSQVKGLKDKVNKNAPDKNIYRDRVGASLAMFHKDMDEDDSNELSTDSSPRTKINTTTTTAETRVGTRVNTTRETTRRPQGEMKYQQAMDTVIKRKLTMGIHHGILTPLPQC